MYLLNFDWSDVTKETRPAW